MDIGWNYGSLRDAGQAPEPEPDGDDVGALLNQAEDIINSAAPEILADFEKQNTKGRFRRKNKNKKKK